MNSLPNGAQRLTATQWLIVSMAALGFAFDIYELLMAQFIIRPAIMDLTGAKPGTPEFAHTVLPFVKQHNTVLLSNHGIVCWADTVTHAEWYAEVLETYCSTLLLASQLGAPISFISESKGSDLLAIKKRLGLPDVRFDTSAMKECQLSELEIPNSIALTPAPCDGGTGNVPQSSQRY